jgi:hypothetical protein
MEICGIDSVVDSFGLGTHRIRLSMPRKKTKPSLKQTINALTAIAEQHLSTMPEEEREKRVAAVARREFTSPRGDSSRQ